MDSCHGDGFRVEPVVGNVVAGAGHGDQTEQKKHSSDLHVDLRRRKAAWTVNSRARGDEGKGREREGQRGLAKAVLFHGVRKREGRGERGGVGEGGEGQKGVQNGVAKLPLVK